MSVTQFNKSMERLFNGNPRFRNVYVKGEVSGKYVSSLGHLYFTLKDKRSQVPCIVFQWFRKGIGFEIENGMKLLVTANVTVYVPHGKYQLDVRSATDEGLGKLHLAFQQLRERLEKECLFEDRHKKQLPKFPRAIGVVTSEGGAVIHDIVKTVESKWPYCQVILFPAAVQGANAKNELISQIRRADRFGLDVLIIGRGGGSLEDLWSFNEEAVVRTVFECETPIISAIGHESDTTLCDLVSDRRASTPTMAASMAIPDKEDILNSINHLNTRLVTFISTKMDKNKKAFENIMSKAIISDSSNVYGSKRSDFDLLRNRFDVASSELIVSNRHELEKIKSSYLIRHPCKMQVDSSKSNLIKLQNRLIDAMNSIINNRRVNLDKVTTNFNFSSDKLLTSKKHNLEKLKKSQFIVNPCQKQLDESKNVLNLNEEKLIREIDLKIGNDKKELKFIKDKPIIKNPNMVYLDKSRQFNLLSDKFKHQSNEIILKNSHYLDSVRNFPAIRNPEKIVSAKRDELNNVSDKFASKSQEIVLTKSHRLDSIKNSSVIRNQIKDYRIRSKNQLNDLNRRLEKGFNLMIGQNQKDLNMALAGNLFRNPEIIYESKSDELDKIKTSRIIENPYLMLDSRRQELNVYREKLDKMKRVIDLEKQQEKQKATYRIIIVAIVILMIIILLVIFGGI